MRKIVATLLLSAVGLSACTTTPPVQKQEPTSSLNSAVDATYRSAENKERDRFRNPSETLNFFGIEPEMTVVEIWPGGGWYTEILAPYLAPRGKYVAAGFNSESEVSYYRQGSEKFRRLVASRSELGNATQVAEFEPPVKTDFIEAGTADAVLTFRNIHNWMSRDGAEAAFASFYKALKPGGILGVVEHRADATEPQDPKAKSGYVRQDYVINLAKAVGFELEATSEINANPKDTKSYQQGVWSLPPSLATKDEEPAKYQAIGESDRMTLKFRKPAH